jgi:hypothetical protein
MKTGSQTSIAQRAADPSPTKQARRRLRRARRWLDLLTVYSINGRARDRWPGQQTLTLHDGLAIRVEAFRRLEKNHTDLFRDVEELRAQDAAAHANAKNLREWHALGAKETARVNRMRRAIRRVRIRAAASGKVY